MSSHTYHLSSRHKHFNYWFGMGFTPCVIVFLVGLVVSAAILNWQHDVRGLRRHQAETRVSFWNQALGREPLQRDSVGRLARDIKPFLTPDQIHRKIFGAGELPKEIVDASAPAGQYPGISHKMGFAVFGDGTEDTVHTYGKFSPEFQGMLVRVRSGDGADVLTRVGPLQTQVSGNPFHYWQLMVGYLGLAGTLCFVIALCIYRSTSSDKYEDHGDVWLNEENQRTSHRPALQLLDWREAHDRKHKIQVVACAPHMALGYSLFHRQVPHLLPHRSGRVSRTKHLRARGGALVGDKATRAYSKLSRKPLPVSKDPKVRYAHQREHLDKLRRTLEDLTPAQRNHPKVKQAFDELGNVTSAYDKLPRLVEEATADIIATRVMGDLQLLKEAPVTFAKAQQEVLAAELDRIKDSRPALEAKLNRDQANGESG